MNVILSRKQASLRPFVNPARSWPHNVSACLSLGLRTASTSSSDEDFDKARRWYAQLQSSPLPREIGEVSYSRSSGPGGQNVNKYGLRFRLSHFPLTLLG